MSFAAVPDLAQRSASARSGSSAATGQADRFGLLLLDEGEYYFKGHTAYYWVEERKRWVVHGWWAAPSWPGAPAGTQSAWATRRQLLSLPPAACLQGGGQPEGVQPQPVLCAP